MNELVEMKTEFDDSKRSQEETTTANPTTTSRQAQGVVGDREQEGTTTIRMRSYVVPLNSSNSQLNSSKRQLLRRGASVTSLGYSSENTDLSEIGSYDELPPVQVESASGIQVIRPAPIITPPHRVPSIPRAIYDNGDGEEKRNNDDHSESEYLATDAAFEPVHHHHYLPLATATSISVPTPPQGSDDEEEEKVEDEITVKKREASGLAHAPELSEVPIDSGYVSNKIQLEETRPELMPRNSSSSKTKNEAYVEKMNSIGRDLLDPTVDDPLLMDQDSRRVGAFQVRGIDHNSDDDEEMGNTVVYSMGGRSRRTNSRPLVGHASLVEGQHADAAGDGILKAGTKARLRNRYLLCGALFLLVCLTGVAIGVSVARMGGDDGSPKTQQEAEQQIPTPAPSQPPSAVAPTAPWTLQTNLEGATEGFASTISMSGEALAIDEGTGSVVVYSAWGTQKGQAVQGREPQLVKDGQTLVVLSGESSVTVFDWVDRNWTPRGQTLSISTKVHSFVISDNTNVLAIGSSTTTEIRVFEYSYESALWFPFGAEIQDDEGEGQLATVTGPYPSPAKLSLANFFEPLEDRDVTLLMISWVVGVEQEKDRSVYAVLHNGLGAVYGNPIANEEGVLRGGPSVSLAGDGFSVAVGGAQAVLHEASEVHLVPIYGQTTTVIEDAKDGEILEVDLSLDGKSLAVAGTRHVNLYEFDDEANVFVTKGGVQTDEGEEIVSFSLSDDAKFLAVGRRSPDGFFVEIYDFRPGNQ